MHLFMTVLPKCQAVSLGDILSTCDFALWLLNDAMPRLGLGAIATVKC
jgi:hypothetical protein